MVDYEYIVIDGVLRHKLQDKLNEMGAQGWKCVTALDTNLPVQMITLTFERESRLDKELSIEELTERRFQAMRIAMNDDELAKQVRD